MFERFKGVIKGGASTVVEQSENLAGKVVGDHSLRPSELKDKLKDGAKSTLKGGKEFVNEGGERIASSDPHQIKDKTKEVAHNVKHYGAFSEGYLGYSDPTKDLRKAVKAKEKAAKKAKKARKKQGKKGTEDLFDPENLAKYRREIEEKRTLALEPSPGISPNSEVGDKSKQASPAAEKPNTPKFEQEVPQTWSNQVSPDFGSPDFGSSEETKPDVKSPTSEGKTPPDKTPRDNEDWKQYLSSGVDLIKKEKEKLDEIKKDSYWQRKKTQVEVEEDAKVARPTTLVGKRKKHWVDLDTEGIEETVGDIVADVSDTEESEEQAEEDQELEPLQEKEEKKEEEEEKEKLPEGYVDIPDDEPIDLDEDEDLFNTGFVDAIVSGDIKLAVIPDSPVEEEGDDPFDTKFADVVVEKHEKEARVRAKVEANRIKFGSLAAAADVLTGKAEKVDKHDVDHALKKKRRRANRINLIAEDLDDVTALEDIEGVTPTEDKPTLEIFDNNNLEPPVGDLLTSSPSPCIGSVSPSESQEKAEESLKLSDELAEFDVVHAENVQLTSNVALLEAEFCPTEFEEEDDPFDEAFTQLAKESITKSKLETLEADLFSDDLFDTSKADAVLGLASLVGVLDKNKEEQVILDTFDDKDPFDTSAYDHITKDLEVDLEFESLAKRDPHELDCEAVIGPDPFDIIDSQLKEQKEFANNEGWAAFGDDPSKPSRPPPPRPAPPRPAPPPPKVQVDYTSGRNTPSVIVKAPSTDSIKSWNVGVAETLILKSEIEAIEAHAIDEALEEKDEFDPLDTSGIDPFDTSAVEISQQ